jgi:hypothetical protein
LLLLRWKAHGVAQPVSVVRALSANDLARHGGRTRELRLRLHGRGRTRSLGPAAKLALRPRGGCGTRRASSALVRAGPEGRGQNQGSQKSRNEMNAHRSHKF